MARISEHLPLICFSLAQIMYATSPYSDSVISADIDPQPIIDEEEGLIWVVGPVLAVVFIICIVIAILLYKRWGFKKLINTQGAQAWESNSEYRASLAWKDRLTRKHVRLWYQRTLMGLA